MAYTYAELEGFWDKAGGDPNVAPIMAAIGEAESSGSNVIQKGQPYSTTGWGIWQITPGNSEPSIGTDNALLNPLTNARAAVAKYKSQGLNAWSTYTSGAYKQYYNSGVAPVTNGSGVSDASYGNAVPVGSNLGSDFVSGLVSGLGLSDLKDLAERAGLIIFGGILLVIGIIKFSGAGRAAVKVVQSGGPQKAALNNVAKTGKQSVGEM